MSTKFKFNFQKPFLLQTYNRLKWIFILNYIVLLQLSNRHYLIWFETHEAKRTVLWTISHGSQPVKTVHFEIPQLKIGYLRNISTKNSQSYKI